MLEKAETAKETFSHSVSDSELARRWLSFDLASERQEARTESQLSRLGASEDRGWKREDLYDSVENPFS